MLWTLVFLIIQILLHRNLITIVIWFTSYLLSRIFISSYKIPIKEYKKIINLWVNLDFLH